MRKIRLIVVLLAGLFVACLIWVPQYHDADGKIGPAKLECKAWEDAAATLQQQDGSASRPSLKDATKYIQDGSEKLLSPWGTPYVIVWNHHTNPPTPRVITVTTENKIVTKRGYERD